jgi:hypothetical protein
VFSQHEVSGEIVSGPAFEQRGNRRAELVEKITELKALLCVERNIGHEAGVYGSVASPTKRDSGLLKRAVAKALSRSYSASPLGPSSVWSWIRTRSGPVTVTAQPRCARCTSLCSTSNVVKCSTQLSNSSWLATLRPNNG